LGEGLRAEFADLDTEIILTVFGPESIIDRINKSMVKLYVDVAGMSEGEHHVEIKAEIDAPYNISGIEPRVTWITISSI
jgi:YbbR domain-containing protein